VVVLLPINCDALRVDGGEGRPADFWFANAHFHGVIRHPQDSQTLPGLGGGTIIDWATWSGEDLVHEVVPLIDGDWMQVSDYELLEDRLVLRGERRSLPDRPAEPTGEAVEVQYVLQADSPWLEVQGANGYWVHPRGGQEVYEGRLVNPTEVLAHDGVLEQDLGGALRISARRLLLAPADQAWAELGGVAAEVAAPEASLLAFYQGDQLLGRREAPAELASITLPPGTTALRSEANGRAPSPLTPVAPEPLTLVLGGRGSLDLQIAWPPEHERRPLGVTWQAPDGRSGQGILLPEGGRLSLGEGRHRLELLTGPDVAPFATEVELQAGEDAVLGVGLSARFDPSPFIPVGLGWPADRDRTYRGSNTDTLIQAWSEGIRYLVVGALNEITGVSGSATGLPTLAVDNGTRFQDRELGYQLVSWSWSANSKHGAHGTPDTQGLPPAEVLAALDGGRGQNWVQADLGWLRVAGPAALWSTWPDFVRLADPGASGPTVAWADWFRALDAGRALVPTGDVTWIPVDDPKQVSDRVSLSALGQGAVSAGNGPLLWLNVDGATPGLAAPEEEPSRLEGRRVVLRWRGAESAYQVALMLDGEVIDAWSPAGPDETLDLRREDLNGRYLTLAAWGGGVWATTGPVWLGPTP
jgi:hypothetical protein